MKTIIYKPENVCSKLFKIFYEDDIIKKIEVTGGCNGNLKAISSLLSGMKIREAIKKIDGIKCGIKNTSCPDQIAQALKKIII